MHVKDIQKDRRQPRRRLLSLVLGLASHQFSLWVSFAICNSLPSFSTHLSALHSWVMAGKTDPWSTLLELVFNLPRSLMLYTPAALELALLCPLAAPLLSGGEEDRPEMAESILVRGSTVSADILAGRLLLKSWFQTGCLLRFMA